MRNEIHKIGQLFAISFGHLPFVRHLTLTQNTCSKSKYLGCVSLSFCRMCPTDESMNSSSSAPMSILRVTRQRCVRWAAVALRFSQLASRTSQLCIYKPQLTTYIEKVGDHWWPAKAQPKSSEPISHPPHPVRT